mmetsp:Transcript_9868/g.25401  ORF Transcript_9868/g.25401 Transcript_9868/m.25401 type:complete len:218 (+) Transcript_9868:1114-1767(+)
MSQPGPVKPCRLTSAASTREPTTEASSRWRLRPTSCVPAPAISSCRNSTSPVSPLNSFMRSSGGPTSRGSGETGIPSSSAVAVNSSASAARLTDASALSPGCSPDRSPADSTLNIAPSRSSPSSSVREKSPPDTSSSRAAPAASASIIAPPSTGASPSPPELASCRMADMQLLITASVNTSADIMSTTGDITSSCDATAAPPSTCAAAICSAAMATA